MNENALGCLIALALGAACGLLVTLAVLGVVYVVEAIA